MEDPDFEPEVAFEAAAPAPAPKVNGHAYPEHELSLIRAVLGDPDGATWAQVGSLPAEALTSPAIGRVWRSLRSGVAVDDPVTLMKSARLTFEEYAELSTGFVTSARASIDADQVRRTWQARRISEIAADMARQPDADPAKWADRLAELAEPEKIRLIGRSPLSFQPIARTHSSVLLGNRFLNRGDGAILSSTSGMGKSSMAFQMAASWAIGESFHGIPSNGELRSLVMQSEDGDGDVAEVFASIVQGMDLDPADRAKLDKNILVVTDRVHRGAAFIAELKRQVARFKPDLVWINPLMGFMDGDLNDARDAGAFLREGLNGLNEPASFGYIIIHHTTKPPKEATKRNWNEVMYDMAGSADLTNWARAILSLRAAEKEGDFNLVLAKRGRRAGVTRDVPQGTGFRTEPVTTIPLRHSGERVTLSNGENVPLIFWVARDADAKVDIGAGRKKKNHLKDYIEFVPAGVSEAKSLAEIWRIASLAIPIAKGSFGHLLNEGIESGIVCRDAASGIPKFYRPV